MGSATAFPPSGSGTTSTGDSLLTWLLIAAGAVLALAAGNIALRKRSR